VTYGSLGNGHASEVAFESFARAARVRTLHVPFKDVGSLLAAVATGDVDFTLMSLNTVGGLATSGRLRALAVAAHRRLPGRPEVPTMVEAGGPDVVMHPWAALVAVAGTPAAVLDQLQRDLAAVLADAQVRARAEQAGFDITPPSAQAVRDRIAVDTALYAPLIDEGRIARL
jgi:tripartite-type tricarboxylate transporter receptor subunit TctC